MPSVTLPASDIQFIGDSKAVRLLYQASSVIEGWISTVKAIQLDGGCIIRTNSEQRGKDGSRTSTSEALLFIPNVRIEPDINGGNKLVPLK